jgi:GTPase KRas protein
VTSGSGKQISLIIVSVFNLSRRGSEGQGFILVYSIASRSTFDRLENFRQSMMRVKRQKPIFILVGNKADKTHEREVSKEEGSALARNFGCDFIETSAKTSQNVNLLFMNLVRALRQTRNIEPGPAGQSRSHREEKKRKCIIV